MGEFVFNECIRSRDDRTPDTRQELFGSVNVINYFCNQQASIDQESA